MTIRRLVQLGHEIELAYGRALPKHTRHHGEVPVYGSNGIVGFHDEHAVSGPGIIVGRKGSVGEVCFSEEPFWPIDTTYYVVNKNAHDWRFLFYLLRHLELTSLNSHSAVPGLNREQVYSLAAEFPELPNQRKISVVLKSVEDAISLESEGISATADLKRAAMRELFTRGLRGEPQKETEFSPVPDSWKEAALDDLAFVQTGVAKGRKLGGTDVVDVPYLRVANVQDGHLDLREMKTIQIRRSEVERYRLQEGDVVLTEGGDFDKLGRGYIWRNELDMCVHQNHVFAVRVNRDHLLPEYFAYLVQSPYGKAYFLKVAHKTTNLACINTTKLKAFPLLVPEKDEQQKIVAILDAIDRKLDLHKQKRAVLDELFNTLLHKLMTGEIRVEELDLSALGVEASS
jgi:type I restriction enzyme S subunit